MTTGSSYLVGCCRRRQLTTRLLPVVFQLLVMFFLWQVFKTQVLSTETRSAVSPRGDSSPPEIRNFLNDFDKSKPSTFLDVNSVQSGGDSNMRSASNYTLNFDIFVRDSRKGETSYYPKGTHVLFLNKTKKDRPENLLKDTVENIHKNEQTDDELSDIYSHEEADADEMLDDNALSYHEDPSKNTIINPLYANGNAILGDFPEANLPDYQEAQELKVLTKNVKIPYHVENANSKLNLNYAQTRLNGMFGIPNTAQTGQMKESQRDLTVNFNEPLQELNLQSEPSRDMAVENKLRSSVQAYTMNRQGQLYNTNQGLSESIMNYNVKGGLISNGGIQNSKLDPREIRNNVFKDMLMANAHDSPLHEHPKIPNNPQKIENFPKDYQDGQFSNGGRLWQDGENNNVNTQVDSKTENMSDQPENSLAPGFLQRVSTFTSELYGRAVVQEASSSASEKTSSEFLINNPDACRSLNEVAVVYLVHSKPQSSDMRQRIRDTYVQSSFFRSSNIVHVFLVGQTTSSNFQASLNHEHQQYLDVVQGDFPDLPSNATQKGLMGLRWATQFCPQAKFIMIINEDVFVDTDKLIHGLIPAVNQVHSDRVMLCFFNPEGPIPRSGPNSLNDELFPGRLNMRPYCKGFAILTTQQVASSLLTAARLVQPFPIPELYLYGVLPFIAGDIQIFDLGNKRAFNNFGMETVNCYQQRESQCPFVASVAFSERFSALWELVKVRLQRSAQWPEGSSLWNLPSYTVNF